MNKAVMLFDKSGKERVFLDVAIAVPNASLLHSWRF